ncbi:hypothetical protein D3C87_1375760 [compost metagenome]
MLLLRDVRDIDPRSEEQEHLDHVVAKLGKQLDRTRQHAENQPRYNPHLERLLRNFRYEIGDLLLAFWTFAPADIDRLIVDLTARQRRGLGQIRGKIIGQNIGPFCGLIAQCQEPARFHALYDKVCALIEKRGRTDKDIGHARGLDQVLRNFLGVEMRHFRCGLAADDAEEDKSGYLCPRRCLDEVFVALKVRVDASLHITVR